jgi:hypothetical protein
MDIKPPNVHNGTTFLDRTACCGGRSRLHVAGEGSVIHPEGGASVLSAKALTTRTGEDDKDSRGNLAAST